VIWEPFILALVLGIIVSAGLYFAYLWPSVEPIDDEPVAVTASPVVAGEGEVAVTASAPAESDVEAAEQATGAAEQATGTAEQPTAAAGGDATAGPAASPAP